MTVLSSLNIVQSDTASLRVREIVSIRQKLWDRIADQIALAEAQGSGQSFQRVTFRRVRDLKNDEVSEIPVRTHVRPWWIQDKDGSVLVWVKYGNPTLELRKGKTAIRIKSRDDLVKPFIQVNWMISSMERFRPSKAVSASNEAFGYRIRSCVLSPEPALARASLQFVHLSAMLRREK